jgi:Zn-dependent protease with chaperone function
MVQPLKSGLSAQHVMHPLDRAGLQAVVSKTAGLLGGGLFTRLMKEAEDDFYLVNLSDNTKLGPNQGASLYRLVADVAGTLGMPTPHVFLDTAAGFKPRTLGGESACLVLPSGLVDALPEDLLRVAVAHELGYILCGHSFYKLLAENFERMSQLAGMLPWVGPLLSAGMRLALLDWYRKAALSADRVALLGTQHLPTVQRYLMWSAGAASRVGSELSAEGLCAQVAELNELIERKRAGGVIDRLGSLLSEVVLQQAWNAHPWPATRYKEVTAWGESAEYRDLLAGKYDSPAAPPAAAGESPEPAAGTEQPTAEDKSLGGRFSRLFRRNSQDKPEG